MKINRKQRFKLFKDLEEGQNTLCQSLLDITEFDNINDTFQKRKRAFNIEKKHIVLKPYIPISEDYKQYDMTPIQKLDLYKKKKIKERFNSSYLPSNSSGQLLKRMYKIRKSQIPKMLSNLNETKKKQINEQFQKQIKRSQNKLKFFRNHGQIDENQFYIRSHYLLSEREQSENRSKFYSLKTGKPEMNENLFPSFQQYVQGKNREKLQQKYVFDVSKIEKYIGVFYTDAQYENNPEDGSESQRKQTKGTIVTSRVQRDENNISSTANFKPEVMSERNPVCRTESMKSKFRVNSKVEKFSEFQIEKSQLSSSKLVGTMSGFYKSKNSKKQEYNNMVSYYDHDRPLTNSIRREKYQFVSPSVKIKPLDHYRHKCEQQRQEILFFNSATYKNILKILERYHEDDIPVSIQILRAMRQLMKKQYIFGQDQVREVLKQIKKKFVSFFKSKVQSDLHDQEKEKDDFMIQPVINVINKAYGFGILWTDI